MYEPLYASSDHGLSPEFILGVGVHISNWSGCMGADDPKRMLCDRLCELLESYGFCGFMASCIGRKDVKDHEVCRYMPSNLLLLPCS